MTACSNIDFDVGGSSTDRRDSVVTVRFRGRIRNPVSWVGIPANARSGPAKTGTSGLYVVERVSSQFICPRRRTFESCDVMASSISDPGDVIAGLFVLATGLLLLAIVQEGVTGGKMTQFANVASQLAAPLVVVLILLYFVLKLGK